MRFVALEVRSLSSSKRDGILTNFGRSAERVLEWCYSASAARYCRQRRPMGLSRLFQVRFSIPYTAPALNFTCSESANGRTLPVQIDTNGPTSIETCTDACFNAGYPLAGAEFATQCFCGLDFTAGSGSTPLQDCNMVCAGNSSEFCGGPNRLNVRPSFLIYRRYTHSGTLNY